MKYIGGEDAPKNVICPSNIPEELKEVYYTEDKNARDPMKKYDKCHVVAGFDFICQKFSYMKIRESMQRKDSYELDSILSEEISENKVNLDGIQISDLPYEDYEHFAKYSLCDTYALSMLDDTLGDMDFLYNTSISMCTRISKALVKTTSIRNAYAVFCRDVLNKAISNNRNSIRPRKKADPDSETEAEESVKFKGAFVADPNLIDYVGMTINGVKSKTIMTLVADEDLESLYPSIYIAWNIDISTMYGKIRFLENVDDIESVSDFVDIFSSDDAIAMGNIYFNLPSASEIVSLAEKISKKELQC